VCLRCQAGYAAVKGADGKSTVQCTPVAAAASAAVSSLAGASCTTQIPGCAAKRCTTRNINGSTSFVCLRCKAGYAAVKGADGKSAVQCVPAATQSAAAVVAAPAAQKVSTLRASLAGSSCPAQIPGCAAKRCTIRTINSSRTYVCLRCQAGFLPVLGRDGVSAVQCMAADDSSVAFNSTAFDSVSQQQQQQLVSRKYSSLLALGMAAVASV
jgi:DNA-directed RNA polymerase subunit RPC12/RpoP